MDRDVVGSRELKTRLGRYLRRVRQGHTLVITDRGEPVAELRPLDTAGSPREAALQKLAKGGLITRPTRRSPGRVTPVRARASASAAIIADRAERG
jgi:prevent-host-death family protein